MSGIDPAATFRQEAAELLDQFEQALLDLGSNSSDRELIDSAFRAMHTIKGSGAMFGFTEVAAFTHDFETAFDRLRKTGAEAGERLISVALSAKDHVRALIEDPESTDPVFGEAILADLHELTGDGGVADSASASAPAEPSAPAQRRFTVKIRFAPDVIVNGTNPLALLDELRSLGDCTVRADLDRIPDLADLDPTQCHVGWTVDLAGAVTPAAIEDVFLFVRDEMDLEIEELAALPAPLPVETTPAPQVPTAAPAQTAPAPAAPGPADRSPVAAQPAKPAAKTEASSRGDERANATVRVQAERLDRLMDRVGELVIAQARLTQLSTLRRDPQIQAIAEEIERLAAGLRDSAMGMRMVPIGSLFGRFRRLVHDLSRDLGKPVQLVTSGEETELDKTVIERLADPLVHLIRNAIDHGIEMPGQRLEKGKSEAGTIRLDARHVGAEVHVTISDDGRGVDLARVRAKGEEQGLVPAGATPSESEILQLMFHPGFSTAREVSALSGRGVGMDVVKQTIEGLRGKIDVTNRPGNGASFTLRLPLTLAIIEGLLVRVADSRYIIPLSTVEECVELSEADEQRSSSRSFLNIRGELVPFVRLRELFGTDPAREPHPKVVIVSNGDSRVGFVVDQIIGNHHAVIKSLSRMHRDVQSFSGVTILGDGLPALIIDAARLVRGDIARPRRDKEAA